MKLKIKKKVTIPLISIGVAMILTFVIISFITWRFDWLSDLSTMSKEDRSCIAGISIVILLLSYVIGYAIWDNNYRYQ